MQQRAHHPYPYWGWAVLSAGLGATIMMKADSTLAFAAGWAGLVLGLVYLAVANRSLARQVASVNHAQPEGCEAKAGAGAATWPTPRLRTRFKPGPDADTHE